MSTRKTAPMPLDILRGKVTKHGQDILALKAAVVDLQARCAKVEVAVGKAGSGDVLPNTGREGDQADEQRPETE